MRIGGAEATRRQHQVSAIVPTIGRPESLRRMLESLCCQTSKVYEVVVADGSSTGETESLVADPIWEDRGLNVRRVAVQPPNAVRQREAAIAESRGDLLLLLDDDVVLDIDCVEQAIIALEYSINTVGVVTAVNNQTGSGITWAWHFYLKNVLGMREGEWQGKIVGPLLRFGYYEPQSTIVPMEWLGTGHTMLRREAYERVGGFSEFFLHRCTINEDVDLGLKISRVGQIVFCPAARLSHFHSPSGRVSPTVAAEDDVYNRYLIFSQTLKYSRLLALRLILTYVLIETTSNFAGCLRRMKVNSSSQLLVGRCRALVRIVFHDLWSLKPIK
jgi:GT2 family glycosyltransferase